jgi:hypothetical protein
MAYPNIGISKNENYRLENPLPEDNRRCNQTSLGGNLACIRVRKNLLGVSGIEENDP